MNNNKICFISCINNQQLYSEALYYINQLEIPEGYEIECISIENAESMTKGYNEAMKASDAKYKVYLHQDVYIVNKSFIKDMLNIFKSNEKIGMLGVIGAKVIPTNAIWWESRKKYGKVYDSHTGQIGLLSFNEVKGEYQSVQAIDGLIMITQCDIPWRQDIFDGWHFYDLSQSIEFIKTGYDVAIPNQVSPWVIHDCGVVNVRNGYEDYRKLFLEEYSKDIFPLVSILIPTYNRPEYFKLALESALNQTYKNIEIIICDDSTNDDAKRVIENHVKCDCRIKYFKNTYRLGKETGLENAQRCLQLSSGEYINFLMDDDLFNQDKITEMMKYYLEYENISLVTSYRQVIDDNGNYLPPIEATKKLFEKDVIISGRELGNFVISNMINIIGEPTTVLFKKEDLRDEFGKYFGRQYYPLSDVSTWLQLMTKGNVVYIAKALSYIRIHKNQNANSIINVITGTIEWFNLIKDSYYKTNYIGNLYYLNNCLKTWLEKSKNTLQYSNQLIFDRKFIDKNYQLVEDLYKCYEECIKSIFLKSTRFINGINELPLVSIIIPAYNHEKYIANTLESIINQTYRNIELIILNDGSIDNTHQVIENYSQILKDRFNKFIYINKRNEGICKTLNIGLKVANGEYIVPFASDDYMFPERIEQQVDFLEKNPDYGMVYTDGFDCNSQGLLGLDCNYRIENLFSARMKFVEGDMFDFLIENVFLFPTPTVCIRKDCFDKVGLYDENLLYEDPDMFLRIAQRFKIGYIDKLLTIHRIHGANSGKDPGILIAGMILMEEKWSKVNLGSQTLKNRLIEYLQRLKTYDYLIGKEFFENGNYERAILHFQIAIRGLDKLTEHIEDIDIIKNMKSINYMHNLINLYVLSLIKSYRHKEAHMILKKYEWLLNDHTEIKPFVCENYEKI